MSAPSLVVKDYMREVMVTFRPDADALRAVHLLLEECGAAHACVRCGVC